MTKSTKDEIEKTIVNNLEGCGFQYAIRHCLTPKYGEGAYEVEKWYAKMLAMWIAQDLTDLIDKKVREATEIGMLKGAKDYATAMAIENSTIPKSCLAPCCLSKLKGE